MSELTPMLRLDLMSLVSLRRVLPAYLGFTIVYMVALGTQMGLTMVGLAGVIVSMNLFSVGESNRLNLLFGTLPLRRRTVVQAHYLISGGVVVAATALGWLIAAATSAFRGEPVAELGLATAVTTASFLTMMAIMQPCYLRWGTRFAGFAFLFFAFGLSGIAILAGQLPIGLTLTRVLEGSESWLPWAGPAVGILAYLASYPIAARIYENQDH
ncbi:MAG: ABC-2 transporter permease [Propioniciclava sp.]|uniref:ABC-2 transporter permease n=1 Tax=Propioniciclava sp. TaxID=2038686 RepID=UPI0039E7028E